MESYQKLEEAFAKWSGLDPANMVACSSGTSALHLALESLQLPQGSKCIVPDYCMVACPRAVVMAGLEPVFVDCDERLLMDPELWKTRIDVDTVVVMFVYIYGRRCTFPETWNKYSPSLRVIEDLAEAHGVKPHPATDAACWSFYKNKIIAGEEGGAVYFRDPKHAALARQLRTLGFTDAHDFMHVPRGHNYRMSNAHADLILDNFDLAYDDIGRPCCKVDMLMQERRYIQQYYDTRCPVEWRQPERQVPWVYDIRIPRLTREKQERVVHTLNSAGIAARMGFKPMSWQSEFRDCQVVGEGYDAAGYNAAHAAYEVLYLPIMPGITTQDDCERAFRIITETLG